MQETALKMTSHFPGLRLTVARQMADYRQRLGDRLREEREAQSLSRETLALRADVSPKTIKRIEEARTNARLVTVRRLADALGIEPTRLRPSEEMEAEQLEQIDAMLRALLDHFEISLPEELAEDGDVAGALEAVEDPATVAEQTADAIEREDESARRQKRSA